MKKHRGFLALVALLVGVAATTGHSEEKAKEPKDTPALIMKLSSPNTVLYEEEKPEATVSITNNGEVPVTLLHPGDGSGCGMRTPIIRWSILRTDSPEKRAKSQAEHCECGTINLLEDHEVFTLAPGESKVLTLDWVPLRPFTTPGEYKVVFFYENRPTVKWYDAPNSEAMQRARNSTQCTLTSNELTFTVSKANWATITEN